MSRVVVVAIFIETSPITLVATNKHNGHVHWMES